MKPRKGNTDHGANDAKKFFHEGMDEGQLNAEIEKLAALPIGVYESRRKAEAECLGMRKSVLDSLVRAKRSKKSAKKPAQDFAPDELRRSADHIIAHPSVLELFVQDLGKVIAGEAINGKLLFLVATSRLFDRPMNAAIKGTSAGGKSEIRKRVLAFFQKRT